MRIRQKEAEVPPEAVGVIVIQATEIHSYCSSYNSMAPLACHLLLGSVHCTLNTLPVLHKNGRYVDVILFDINVL